MEKTQHFNQIDNDAAMQYQQQRLLRAFALTLLAAVLSVHGAHSRARTRFVSIRKENNFDRTTTSFSAEGRLLQVEYGLEAAQRSSTAAVINLESQGDIDCCEAILVIVRKWNNLYRLDERCWMLGTGLSGDARFMAQRLQEFCQESRKQYGEAPTIREVAQQAAGLQHQLTRRENYRPLGCSAMILGLDENSPHTHVYRTGPGGILEECRYGAAGKNQDKVMKELEKQYKDDNEEEKDIRSRQARYVKAAIHSFDLAGEETVDVWTIQHDPQGTGKARATCFLKVDKQNFHAVSKELSRAASDDRR